MSIKRTSLATIGTDPMSEENVRKRLQFLRESAGRGIVKVPVRWLKNDPALAQAVQELDWLQTEAPPDPQQEADPPQPSDGRQEDHPLANTESGED